MAGRLVGAICSGCGGDLIFSARRRRKFAEEELRCPGCIPPPARPRARLARSERSSLALNLVLAESRLRRALDPDEPESQPQRFAIVRDVADELRELSNKLVPPADPDQSTLC